MRVVHRDFAKGVCKMRVEVVEDIWHLSQIIEKGDFLSGRTQRRIEYGGEEEKSRSEKKPVFLKIHVDKVELAKDVLRVGGKIVEVRSKDVSLGEYHSFNLGVGSVFTLKKESWGALHVDRLKQAVSSARRPKLFIVLLDVGEACFFNLTPMGLRPAGSYKEGVGGKMYAKEFSKNVSKFFGHLEEKIKSQLPEGVGQVVVAGVGFVHENFLGFLKQKGSPLAGKLVLAKVGSAGKSGAQELLKSRQLERLLSKHRVYLEAQAVEGVLLRISKGEKVAYGFLDVKEKAELGAVGTLFITDRFFSEERDACEKLVKLVEQSKGEVMFLSFDNQAGKKLHSLGGVAAFLRY